MPKKVFDKKLEPRCEYCVFGKSSEFTSEVMCPKRGMVDAKDSCRSYRYDPLKREPQRIKIAKDYKPEDFSV